MPEGEPDQDRRLAGAPRQEDQPGSTGDRQRSSSSTPSIEFEDMQPPALPPKQPL